MYKVKFKSSEEKNCTIVLSRACDIEEAIKIAKSYDFVAEVYSVSLSQFKEVYYKTNVEMDLIWYDVTLVQSTVDPENGKEKKVQYHILVEAEDFDNCSTRVKEIVKQGYEMERTSIKKTNIINVYQDVIANDHD